MPAKGTVKLSSNFRITIPKSLRDAYQWQAGQELAFIPKQAGVLLVAVPSREELFGIARGANPHGYRDRNDRY